MDAIFCLHTRRSIRKYTNQPVAEEDLQAILEAGMIAPSAGNSQPWHFVVIRDKATLGSIPAFHPYAAMAPAAPLAIVVCGHLKEEKYAGFWVQDCSAATQNILLAANALGLGAVWAGIYPVQERVNGCRALLGIPEDVVPLSLVVIGHPEKPGEYKSRFNAAKVHFERW